MGPDGSAQHRNHAATAPSAAGLQQCHPRDHPNSSFPKTASDYSLQRTPRWPPHRLGPLLAAGGYLATCPLAIFPPFRDRCGSGRRQGCHGSHPSAASAAGPPGTSSGGLCPGWALQHPPLRLPPMHGRAAPFTAFPALRMARADDKYPAWWHPCRPADVYGVLTYGNEAETLQLPAATGGGDVLGRVSFGMGSPSTSSSYLLMNAPSSTSQKLPQKISRCAPPPRVMYSLVTYTLDLRYARGI